MNIYQELIQNLRKQSLSSKQFSQLKRELCKKYKVHKPPTNFEILLHAKESDLKKIKNKLLTKPTRTISGVSPIAVMTRPFKCPHGKCLMCPGGPNSHFGDVPQSYTGKEPATMRGIRNKYDSYLQVFNRLEQYIVLGHDINKIELIVMGGTFPSFPKKYQDDFIIYAFKAMNDFSKLFFTKNKFNITKFKKFFYLPGPVGDPERTKKIHKKLEKLRKKSNLEKEQKINQTSNVRCIAICIETRPDYCQQKHIKQMLRLGTTRVELGVQHIDNQVLKKIKRGHTIEDTIQATKLLKQTFLKVGYHIMPGLPGSSIKKDKQMFKELFKNPDFKPDALKIYPCMVTKGTELYELYKKKKYKPLTTKKAAKLISEIKQFIPKYCRIMRVQRDIPTYQTVAGVGLTNLRQLIHQKYKPNCQCIRCREPKNKTIDWHHVKILKIKYQASQGTEYFISVEDTKNNLLLGFCRLRINKEAGIRELHVYGQATKLGQKGSIQHQGLGKQLIKIAEQIAQNKTLKIISGIGVREYYKKLGYKKQEFYMVKQL
ncbi:MAG: tRNA uridine(34) 5-carboxymethylaminomethyl modification radical SAM/GNAT enzyme Elp3 [Nanoarchaeota archaeon]|nr:tRNA uridine(34) 5-carboxymethylaminomethyl modification radical SAM/GNAT enzyme Elp3 [Nanoarchaeota archaeon]